MPAKRARDIPGSECDLVVAGGGVAGLGLAWRAARSGRDVVVVDREAPGAATRVAAGMLAPVTEADVGERALLELGLAAAHAWPAFAEELEEAAGKDPGLRRSGALVVARDRDEAEALDRELAFRTEMGLEVDRLLPTRARRLEPALAPTVRLALHAPDDHSADPGLLVTALRAAGERAGVRFRDGEQVAAVLTAGERVAGLRLSSGDEVRAADTALAIGAWSGELAGLPVAARVPVRPVKGQLLRLRDPEGPGLLQRVVRFEGGYLVPRGDGRYVLGATQEERGFDTTVTAGGVYELLRDASELVPGVLELVVEEALAGLRPGTPDNAPVIGRPPGVEGLVWATGHHRNGILLAPVAATLALGALDGDDVPPAFSPARFAGDRGEMAVA